MDKDIEKIIIQLYHDYGNKGDTKLITELEKVSPPLLRQVLSTSPFLKRVQQRYEHCVRFLKGEPGVKPYFREIVHGYKRNFRCTKKGSQKIIGYWELLKSLYEKCSLNRACNPGDACDLNQGVCIPSYNLEVSYSVGNKIITGTMDVVIKKIQQHFEPMIGYSTCTHGSLKDNSLNMLVEGCDRTKILAFMNDHGKSVYCELRDNLINYWRNIQPETGFIVTPQQLQKGEKFNHMKRDFYPLSPDVPGIFLMKDDIEKIANSKTCFYILVPMSYRWLDQYNQNHGMYLVVPVEKEELDIDDLDFGALQI